MFSPQTTYLVFHIKIKNFNWKSSYEDEELLNLKKIPTGTKEGLIYQIQMFLMNINHLKGITVICVFIVRNTTMKSIRVQYSKIITSTYNYCTCVYYSRL